MWDFIIGLFLGTTMGFFLGAFMTGSKISDMQAQIDILEERLNKLANVGISY